MSTKKRYTWSVDIAAPAAIVHDKMLGITDKQTYGEWVAAFGPGSSYEGNWQKGTRIRFVGKDENGKVQGVFAEIKENIPGQFVSIHHLGMIDDDKEITEGPELEKWKNNMENYTFEEKNGITTVKVEVDLPESDAHYFTDMWPEALKKLKEISESN